jgi:hypothetical protein
MVEPDPNNAPVTPDALAVHAKVVPGTLADKEKEVVPPEQNTCVNGVAIATGIRLTVTVSIIGAPAQEPVVGIIVIIAVPGTIPVVVKV